MWLERYNVKKLVIVQVPIPYILFAIVVLMYWREQEVTTVRMLNTIYIYLYKSKLDQHKN